MRKDLLIVAFIGLILFFVINGTKIQSVDEYYLTHLDDIQEGDETVTLTIRCDTVLNHLDRVKQELLPYIEKDGVILEETEYVLREGDTVFDILQRATRHERIQMEYQGADQNEYKSVYVQGIHYLYEFSCGSLSGWMYKVNGEFPSYGVSQYRLKDGDKISFLYTCDLGRDLGVSF